MRSARTVILCLLAIGLAGQAVAETHDYDIVVYGGTSAGVTAAVQAARMGKNVALIDPGCYVGDGTYLSHLGGLSSGGLGATDVGDSTAIGGLAYEFYQRENALGGGSGYNVISSKAEQAYDNMISESGVDLYRLERLDLTSGVAKSGTRITSITTHTGTTFRGKAFIDATYEGDLMAGAGVSYTVGREARSEYGESYNGIAYDQSREHTFSDNGANVDPYVIPGNPSSGLIDGVHLTGQDPAGNGAADGRIQAYCYRMTWTDGSSRVRWTDLWGSTGQNPPENYDRSRYEVHDRYIQETGNKLSKVVRLDTGIGNNLNDINNWGPASTDFIGGNYDVYIPSTGNTTNYAEATHEEREYIIKQHIDYTMGFLYYLAFDSPVTGQMANWGLAPGEYTDNGNFPHQLYVREARRMIGEYIMTEDNCRDFTQAPNPIGLGAYPMDSHNTHRYIDNNGDVESEGNFWLGGIRETYSIDYGAITPQQQEASNLLVAAAVSASHTAFGSMRMEPVFMVLGQSAATAAVRAIEEGVDVQDIDIAAYQELMRRYGQKLTESEPGLGEFVGTTREDFNYGPSDRDLGSVSYIRPGFSQAWQTGSNAPGYDASANLTYTGAGYVNSSSYGDSGGAGDASSTNITTRSIQGGMSGEIWLSALVRVDSATGEEALLWLDGTSTDDAAGIAEGGYLELFGQALSAGLADGQTHLLLARLNVQAGNDEIDLWVDPNVLSTIAGDADLSASGSDLFGDTLDELGLSLGASGGMIDAIRMSNLTIGYSEVLGMVPGDLDLDGIVGFEDAATIVANLGKTDAGIDDGDMNGNGLVELFEAELAVDAYNIAHVATPGFEPMVVPEPATAVLLGSAALAGLLRRRRRG